MKKPRTARAIEPNAGTKRKFKKKLKTLLTSFQKYALKEMILTLLNQNLLAQDAQTFRKFTTEEKDVLKRVGRELGLTIDIEHARTQLDIALATQIARMLIKFNVNAKAVSSWFCNVTLRECTNAQKRALKAAGVSKGVIERTFNIPIVKTQHVAPSAAQQLPKFVERMTNLITKTAASDLAKVQEMLITGLEQGQSYSDMAHLLTTFDGFDDRRAERVAQDQSTKLNNEVLRLNSIDLGMTDAIWIHVPGKYTSRETHIHMNGKRYSLLEGMYDPDPKVGRNIQTGELTFCRCVHRVVIPEELLKD